MADAPCAVFWFRNDLRLHDNPALEAAVASGLPVLPLYIWQPDDHGGWAPGAASRLWLHHSLIALEKSLEARGSSLIIKKGPAKMNFDALIERTPVAAVYWNRRYPPALVAADSALKTHLASLDVAVHSFNGNFLVDPVYFHNKQGGPYKVFTPFWKNAAATIEVPEPTGAPKRWQSVSELPASLGIDELGLVPGHPWAGKVAQYWNPGEDAARAQLAAFVEDDVSRYGQARDFPGVEGTSKLSAPLHFGEISPRQLYFAAWKSAGDDGAGPWLRQLYWREFGNYLLYHFPETPDQPLRPEFERFPWEHNAAWLKAWQRGQTGYPLVDAGMRELWETGWMHNRVRMVVASFLVKHLRLHWREGAKWFWDTLVDADLANNTLGWQWSAGCGADAAPYFRIFNPEKQGLKFDARGGYVRAWVPELARLDDKAIFAPNRSLEGAALEYPAPVVDHATAREAALGAYQAMRGG